MISQKAAAALVLCHLSLLSILLVPRVEAYFLDLANGVRPAGMGEAFVAVADDANAMLFNPAGLARLTSLEINSMYSDLYAGLNARLFNGGHDHSRYHYLALVVPGGQTVGTFGFGWTQLDTIFYKENIFTLTYGRRLWYPHYLDWGLALDVGMSVKGMQWLVAENEFTVNPLYFPYSERHKIGYTGDVGILATMDERLSVGISLENVIPADVGLTVTEYVPPIYRLGAAYQIEWQSHFADTLLATVELSERQGVLLPKFGVESWWFQEIMALRAGVNSDRVTAGLSAKYELKQSPLALQVDYAFSYPFQIADTIGSHRVGMTILWDLRDSAAEQKAMQAKDRALHAARLVQAAEITRREAEKAAQAAAAAGTVANKQTTEAFQIIRQAEVRARAAAESAGQAAEVLKEVSKTDSDALRELAMQIETDAQSAARSVEEITEYSIKMKIQKWMVEMEPGIEDIKPPVIVEKYKNKIVIGVEAKVFTDFGGVQEIQTRIRPLQEFIKQRTKIKVEWRLLSLTEVQLAFKQGEIDVILSHQAKVAKYLKQGLIKPIITVNRDGRDSQPCVLIARADSSINKPEDLRGRRLGYSNEKLVSVMGPLFFPRHADQVRGKYFSSLEKHKNARDSLWALQMNAVDAIVEYGYITTIYDKLSVTMPTGIKVIATSRPLPNIPFYVKASKYKTKNDQLDQLMFAFLGFHRDPSSRAFLDFWDIRGFTLFDEKHQAYFFNQTEE